MRAACSKLLVIQAKSRMVKIFTEIITVSVVEICPVPIKMWFKWFTVSNISPADHNIKNEHEINS